MSVDTRKIFLASSSELEDDRMEFEIFVNRKNKQWVSRGVFLELVMWEDFLDAMSRTRLQDDYDKAVEQCDIFVMLFWTKVGKYTEEEFERAFKQFRATQKPYVFTYFKDTPVNIGSNNREDVRSLLAFQEKLEALGHYQTTYRNVDALKLHFGQQLDKLAASGFSEFLPKSNAGALPANVTYEATLTGGGAIAQGGATAIGAGGVSIGGNNVGNIDTSTRAAVNTGGSAYIAGSVSIGGDFVGRDNGNQRVPSADLETLFAPLLQAVTQQAPPSAQLAAIQQVEELKAEVAKGLQADDGKLKRIVDGLVDLVPDAVGSLIGMFASPVLSGIVAPATKFLLEKLRAI